jgi:hypothetical protein
VKDGTPSIVMRWRYLAGPTMFAGGHVCVPLSSNRRPYALPLRFIFGSSVSPLVAKPKDHRI